MTQGQDQVSASRPFRLYGFATGDYTCTCMTCGAGFIGDKRAVTCLPCAADQAEAGRTPPPAVSEVREAVAAIILDTCKPDRNSSAGQWEAWESACWKADAILALPLPRMGEGISLSQSQPSGDPGPQPRPAPDPWTQWNGGENPAPGKKVEVKFRDDDVDFDSADDFMWSHVGDDTDIIAYRIIPHSDGEGET